MLLLPKMGEVPLSGYVRMLTMELRIIEEALYYKDLAAVLVIYDLNYYLFQMQNAQMYN